MAPQWGRSVFLGERMGGRPEISALAWEPASSDKFSIRGRSGGSRGSCLRSGAGVLWNLVPNRAPRDRTRANFSAIGAFILEEAALAGAEPTDLPPRPRTSPSAKTLRRHHWCSPTSKPKAPAWR